jgi:hypothetical protein
MNTPNRYCVWDKLDLLSSYILFISYKEQDLPFIKRKIFGKYCFSKKTYILLFPFKITTFKNDYFAQKHPVRSSVANDLLIRHYLELLSTKDA